MKNIFKHQLQLSSLTTDENRKIITKALESLNCTLEWKKEDDEQSVRYDYQSGHFSIHISPKQPQVQLAFLFIADMDVDDLNVVRYVCNLFNINSDGPRFTYTIIEKSHRVHVHMMTTLLLDEDRAKDILELAMRESFGWQNAFAKHLQETKADSKSIDTGDMERLTADVSYEHFLLNEQELHHQKVAPGWRINKNKAASIAEWLQQAYDWNDVTFSELTVVTESVEKIKGDQVIKDYDIVDTLIKDGAFVREYAMLDVTFFLLSEPEQKRRMTFSVQQGDTTEGVLYVQVVSTLVPLKVTAERSLYANEVKLEARSALLGYDLRNDKQRQDEFIYLWKEAQAKMDNGQVGELTDEQELLANAVNEDVGRYILRGKRLYHQKRFLEAVTNLENAFRIDKDNFDQLGKQSRKVFFETCFMLGFCYTELKQYEKAFYYLSCVSGLNQINYAEEYINCLVNMGDHRALANINSILDDLKREYSEEEVDEPDFHLGDFISFLNRRKAFVLIEKERLDEAEEILQAMLDDPDNYDFAVMELKYINLLRLRNAQS